MASNTFFVLDVSYMIRNTKTWRNEFYYYTTVTNETEINI